MECHLGKWNWERVQELRAQEGLFSWNHGQAEVWVLSSCGSIAGRMAQQTSRHHCSQLDKTIDSLKTACAAKVGVKVRISQTRMSKLPCPTYPTVSWINERESWGGEVLWVHLLGEERDVFFCICTGGPFEASQNKLPHLGNGLNRLAGCESIFNVCKEKHNALPAHGLPFIFFSS